MLLFLSVVMHIRADSLNELIIPDPVEKKKNLYLFWFKDISTMDSKDTD